MNAAGGKEESKVDCDVLVQGAGIGGLTLAIALRQRGYRVRVVERARGLAEVGAGIWMAPNAMQVFARLGFAQKVMEAGWAVKQLRLQDWKSGDLQTTDMSQIAREYGFETTALHRGVLQRVLFEQVEPDTVWFGCVIDSLGEGDGCVHAKLADGSACKAAIVVGADGLHSAVRGMAGQGGVKRYSGSSSYRAIARGAGVLRAEAAHDAYEVWAKGCRVGFSRINADDCYWYMTFDAAAGVVASAEETRAHAESLFRKYFPQWIGLLEHTQTQDILRTDISDLEPLKRWSAGRVGLMGDAAHATTPNLGQGGAMAVEDAMALADALAASGLQEAALRQFEEGRRAKVDWTVATSWSIGKVCHVGSPVLRLLRNVALRHTPASVTRKQIERLYRL